MTRNDKSDVCILDYGSGNIKSVFNLLSALVASVKISNSEEDIINATHLVLPGVGAFGVAMEKIRRMIPVDLLENEVLSKNKPFLGICVGMQVLADKGYEHGEYDGLGWIAGEITRLEAGRNPLPHIGWNNLEIKKISPILDGIDNKYDFYFLHSYAFRPEEENSVVAKTEYGENFVSVIQQNNIFGTQFHPEKSQNTGKLLINNFLKFNEKE